MISIERIQMEQQVGIINLAPISIVRREEAWDEEVSLRIEEGLADFWSYPIVAEIFLGLSEEVFIPFIDRIG